jgi:hypothetical protein
MGCADPRQRRGDRVDRGFPPHQVRGQPILWLRSRRTVERKPRDPLVALRQRAQFVLRDVAAEIIERAAANISMALIVFENARAYTTDRAVRNSVRCEEPLCSPVRATPPRSEPGASSASMDNSLIQRPFCSPWRWTRIPRQTSDAGWAIPPSRVLRAHLLRDADGFWSADSMIAAGMTASTPTRGA